MRGRGGGRRHGDSTRLWELEGKDPMRARREVNEVRNPGLGPRSGMGLGGEAGEQCPEAGSLDGPACRLEELRQAGWWRGLLGLGDLGSRRPERVRAGADWWGREQRERQKARPGRGAWRSALHPGLAPRVTAAHQASGVSAKLLADSREARGRGRGGISGGSWKAPCPAAEPS